MVFGMAIRMLGKEVRYLLSSLSPNSYAWVVTSILFVVRYFDSGGTLRCFTIVDRYVDKVVRNGGSIVVVGLGVIRLCLGVIR